jgi:CRISPR-associated protein Cmr6
VEGKWLMTTWEWTLPQALRDHLQTHWQSTQHFGLLLDKFSPYAEYEYTFRERGQVKTARGYRLGKDNLKRTWINNALTTQKHLSPVIQANVDRWQKMVDGAGGKSQPMYTASPLIVGLGVGHVLESSITLEHNTGVPLIPGSALKGLARNVGLIEVARATLEEPQLDELAKLEEEITKGKTDGFTKQKQGADLTFVTQFVQIFGTLEAAGNIVFVDAIYTGDRPPDYHLDIMNPHFPKYYSDSSGHTPPSDDQSPIPVPYLTVGTRQEFTFAVLPRRKGATEGIDKAWEWLQEGLTEFGVGAKTSQGYGLFIV